MDYLCELPNDAARRVALDSLPPDLNSTYERILDRVEASNTEVQKLVQRSLRWIICSETPLSLDALCEVVSVNEGDVILHYDAIADEEEILRWCSSLLRKSAAGDGLELVLSPVCARPYPCCHHKQHQRHAGQHVEQSASHPFIFSGTLPHSGHRSGVARRS